LALSLGTSDRYVPHEPFGQLTIDDIFDDM
jgi:hypothetical protein